MPFKTEKFSRKGLFGGDRASKDSEDGSSNPPLQNYEAAKKNEEKVPNLRKRIEEAQIPASVLDDGYIGYALRSRYSAGNEDKAFEYLLFIKDAIEGVVRPYDPKVRMLGAVNRETVTCWLDATLFAMFSNLTSFEPMLLANFEDPQKSRLVVLIRLWVNLLRAGKLIDVDLTKEIQDTLRRCGWDQAGELCQNDASEAFSFITGTLGLPLLTMEMDIFHEGGNDEADHKIVNERLLEVAVPQSNNGTPVRLEDCLEDHFNTRVEVMRRMNVRRDTLNSKLAQSPMSLLGTLDDDVEAASFYDENKSREVVHDEATHLLPESPIAVSESPTDLRPTFSRSLATLRGQSTDIPVPRPGMNRERATSIIRRIVVSNDEDESGPSSMRSSPRPPSMAESARKGSVRKEVLMPAWQFFKILPWYTTDVPNNDDQVAAHFSKSSPVIGICLKRYSWSSKGEAIRSNTVVDIPLQIALPHFIQDDFSAQDGAPIFGNFKMVLQSMVCHRGESVSSGHYISIIRAGRSDKQSMIQSPSGGPPAYSEDQWIKLDDLNQPRVETVSIDDAMKKETPYLLFYQVQPMFDETSLDAKPPPYQTGEVAPNEAPMPYEEEDSFLSARSTQTLVNTNFTAPEAAHSVNGGDFVSPVIQPSGSQNNMLSVSIQEPSPITESSATGYFPSNNTSESWTKSRISISSDTEPTTNSSLNTFGTEVLSHSFSENDMDKAHDRPFTAPENYKALEQDKSSTQPELGNRLSRAASRLGLGPRSRHSRPQSQNDELRKTGTFSKLSLMRMKEKEDKKDKEKEKDASSGTDHPKKSSESSSADASLAPSVTDLATKSSYSESVDADTSEKPDKTEKPDFAGLEMKQKDKKKEKHEKEKSEKEKSEKEKDKDKEKEHHHRHSFHRGHMKGGSTHEARLGKEKEKETEKEKQKEKEKEKPERECSIM